MSATPPVPRVHEDAAVGFDRAAGAYERGRPGYPPAVVAKIAAELGVGRGHTVVDLAAGTGKLTRRLTALGARVIAVEPVAGMRAELERVLPEVTVLDGTAEQLPLADGAVRAVFVAQAFHWFRVPEAASEITRVLDGAGGLAIIRNDFDSDGAVWVPELLALLTERAGEPEHRRHRWREQLEATGRFVTPLDEWTVPNPVTSDIPAMRDRIASLSYIARLDPARRAALLDAAQAMLEGHGMRAGEAFAVPTVTRVLLARQQR